MDSTEVEQLNFWVLNNYAFAASAALWMADFIATLPTEIRTMWLRKPTGTSVLFILNRYSFLLFLFIGLVAITPGNSTDQGCQRLYYAYGVLEILSVVMTSALFTLRVYAIYNKSRIILVVSALLITLRLFTDTVYLIFTPGSSTSGSAFQKFSRCGLQYNDTLLFNKFLLSNILQVATPCITLAFDALIFGLTIQKTIRHTISMQRLGQASVTQVVLIDGVLYFLIMIVVAVIDVIFSLTALFTANNPSTILIFIIPFFDILPNILISRLVLNLRTFSSLEETRSQRITRLSGMNFATNRMLGNIGAPLQSGDMEQEEEDVEE